VPALLGGVKLPLPLTLAPLPPVCAVQSIPTSAALESAKVVVDRLLERQRSENEGKYPETVALVLWGTDNIKTYGESLAQVSGAGCRPCLLPLPLLLPLLLHTASAPALSTASGTASASHPAYREAPLEIPQGAPVRGPSEGAEWIPFLCVCSMGGWECRFFGWWVRGRSPTPWAA